MSMLGDDDFSTGTFGTQRHAARRLAAVGRLTAVAAVIAHARAAPPGLVVVELVTAVPGGGKDADPRPRLLPVRRRAQPGACAGNQFARASQPARKRCSTGWLRASWQ